MRSKTSPRTQETQSLGGVNLANVPDVCRHDVGRDGKHNLRLKRNRNDNANRRADNARGRGATLANVVGLVANVGHGMFTGLRAVVAEGRAGTPAMAHAAFELAAAVANRISNLCQKESTETETM